MRLKYNRTKECGDATTSYDIERSYKSWQEELERTRSKNEWMTKFLESLETT